MLICIYSVMTHARQSVVSIVLFAIFADMTLLMQKNVVGLIAF